MMKKIIISIFIVFFSTIISIEQKLCNPLPQEIWNKILEDSKLVENMLLADNLPNLKNATYQLVQFSQISKFHNNILFSLLRKKLQLNEEHKITLKDLYIQRENEILKKIKTHLTNKNNEYLINFDTIDDQYDYDEFTKDYTNLMHACRLGDLQTAKLLIQNDANLNVQDNDGWTALMWASMFGEKEIVDLLIQNKASLDIKNNNGNTALIIAFFSGKTDIVELLIQSGANINIVNKNGFSALYYAIFISKNVRIASLILKKKIFDS